MRFGIGGYSYEITREGILAAVRGQIPEQIDARHKYYVEIEDRKFPIKQVLSLVTGLPSGEFISQYAQRALPKLGFDVKKFEPLRAWAPTPVSPTALSDSPRRAGTNVRKFAVTLEEDEDGLIVASCPALLGCHSQGRSREEALTNIREAIRGYIASMQKHQEEAPNADWAVVEVSP